MDIKFGTDGWRAVIGEGFTFENIKIVSQAVADYIKGASAGKGQEIKVAVGYDTRFMGSRFADTVARVLAANGLKVFLSSGPTSTPAVSLSIRQNKYFGAIMVTASHNPPHYSGIKYKAGYAGPADSDIIKPIEELLGRNPVKLISADEAANEKLITMADLNKPHLNFLKSYIDLKLLKIAQFRVLVDVMYGAGDHLMEQCLKGSDCRLETIHSELNPGFGGTPPEPIEKNLKELIARVKKHKYDIGLATDGDVDRIGAITSEGKFITSSLVIALLLVHFVEDKKWTGAVAKTISGSFLIDKIAESYNLKLYETPVGFKHICKLMQTQDILIGGEESGGIGFKNYIPERDGTLAGLLLLEMMAQRKTSMVKIIKDLERRFGKYVQLRLDLEFPDEKKAALFSQLKEKPPKELMGETIAEIKTYDGIKLIGKNKSWLLFRASGTEPILRIYCESNTETKTRKLLEFGKGLALKT